MFMSVLDSGHTAVRYGELAGTRVMITGLSVDHGVDIARAFADHKARLVLQSTSADQPETMALLSVLAEAAHEITVFDTPLDTAAHAQAFAQKGAQSYGSLDAVVNIVAIRAHELSGLESMEDIETFIGTKLQKVAVITRIAANRMRMMLTEGLILNVIVAPDKLTKGGALIVGMVRSALASMTRIEAEAWAANGIRINAIGPTAALPGDKTAAALASEPEMASVALYLASKRAHGLSGHVFDAVGVLTACP